MSSHGGAVADASPYLGSIFPVVMPELTLPRTAIHRSEDSFGLAPRGQGRSSTTPADSSIDVPDCRALESGGGALGATSQREGAMADVAGEHRTQGLRRGVVGFSGVLFQSITFMAPAIATAFSIPAGIAFSGGGAPLSVIFALVASLLAAVSIGQLSKHMPTAGSFYTYVSNGLHPAVRVDRLHSGHFSMGRRHDRRCW